MTDNALANEEIVSFPVPKRYLPVVIRALADAMEGGSTPLPPSSPEPLPKTPTNGNRGWTKEEVTKLMHALQNQTVRTLLDMTAAQPEHWVGFRDLMSTANRGYGQARGDLAGFTQLLKRTFDGRDTWPVQVEWSDDGAQIVYRMTPDVARWWKEAP